MKRTSDVNLDILNELEDARIRPSLTRGCGLAIDSREPIPPEQEEYIARNKRLIVNLLRLRAIPYYRKHFHPSLIPESCHPTLTQLMDESEERAREARKNKKPAPPPLSMVEPDRDASACSCFRPRSCMGCSFWTPQVPRKRDSIYPPIYGFCVDGRRTHASVGLTCLFFNRKVLH